MTPAEGVAPAAPPAEAQYQLSLVLQKQGDNRALEIRNALITVDLVVENPMLARLLKSHAAALAAHDAGQLREASQEAAPTVEGATGKPN